ncbi:MAG: hypothetical protein RI947_35 [Candidatus Parcubacteria bacterium]|jgi:(heptosyl)LPS beta-1,4-glucosyltransferase
MNNVSAIIVVKDNPPHLKETLKSIREFVSEIIIADIGIDPTLIKDLKSESKVTIHTIEKAIPYVELIREDLKKKAKGDYILLLDPDEYVTPQLIDLLTENMSSYDYISIPRKNIIFKKWIQYSRWWPDYQVRFFKKTAVIWPKQIHQQPITIGNGLTIRADEQVAIVHYNYESIDEYMGKAVRYAKAEAAEIAKADRGYNLSVALGKGLSEFISRYFAAQGYRDGMHGFVLAVLQMFYCMLVYFYYWELKKYPAGNPAETAQTARNFFRDSLIESNHWMNQQHIHETSRIKTKVQNFILKKLK